MTTLDLAVVTHQPSGINRVENMILDPIEGVRYIISWQSHQNAPIPESLMRREDVEIHRLDINGISNNRNNAIDFCKGDIVLFSDDDMVYSREGILKIIETFDADRSLEVALFKVDFFNKKKYPEEESLIKLPFPQGYFVSSVEIAFRRKKIRDLRCWPGLGLGSGEMVGGEDEFFIISCIKRGLCCKFIPHLIGKHPYPSTGDRISSGILISSGFIISVVYPMSCVVRIILKAWRVSKSGDINFISSLKALSKGLIRSNREVKKIPSRYRW